jgi:hypothetical protein
MTPIRGINIAIQPTGTITFCESYSQVCDAVCRANTDRDINPVLSMGRR